MRIHELETQLAGLRTYQEKAEDRVKALETSNAELERQNRELTEDKKTLEQAKKELMERLAISAFKDGRAGRPELSSTTPAATPGMRTFPSFFGKWGK